MTKKSLMQRFDFLTIKQGTVRTFNKEIYEVKASLVVKNIQTNTLKKVEDIYYDIRTVKDKHGKVIAKRKSPNQDLFIL
ncbi:hypothetical protein [Amphibacillus cookii]|uniref:hypothetical protein n=1 Tax=Amphibacillus cookii TaxID=767787 RepID=UPI00195E1201|nr:hypothetical protein [Amphibacillus cookii]MBM7541157.1 hypothetical protein [Amphibacillus cookii]